MKSAWRKTIEKHEENNYEKSKEGEKKIEDSTEEENDAILEEMNREEINHLIFSRGPFDKIFHENGKSNYGSIFTRL